MGKGIGVANKIDFTATGETDNGYMEISNSV